MGISQTPTRTGRTWVEIASSTPTSPATTVTFSSIPAYTNLAIRADQMQLTASQSVNIRFNGDTGNNYSWSIFGQGSGTVGSSGSGRDTSIRVGTWQGGSSYNSAYIIIDDANQIWRRIWLKTFSADSSSAQTISFNSEGQWNNASAITSIDIIIPSASTFNGVGTIRLLGSF